MITTNVRCEIKAAKQPGVNKYRLGGLLNKTLMVDNRLGVRMLSNLSIVLCVVVLAQLLLFSLVDHGFEWILWIGPTHFNLSLCIHSCYLFSIVIKSTNGTVDLFTPISFFSFFSQGKLVKFI